MAGVNFGERAKISFTATQLSISLLPRLLQSVRGTAQNFRRVGIQSWEGGYVRVFSFVFEQDIRVQSLLFFLKQDTRERTGTVSEHFCPHAPFPGALF